jgi:hypothetical protein
LRLPFAISLSGLNSEQVSEKSEPAVVLVVVVVALTDLASGEDDAPAVGGKAAIVEEGVQRGHCPRQESRETAYPECPTVRGT